MNTFDNPHDEPRRWGGIAVVGALHSLETQFDESPLFQALAGQDLQAVEAGLATLPATAGFSMVLQPEILASCRRVHWTAARAGNGIVVNREDTPHGDRRQD